MAECVQTKKPARGPAFLQQSPITSWVLLSSARQPGQQRQEHQQRQARQQHQERQERQERQPELRRPGPEQGRRQGREQGREREQGLLSCRRR